MLKKILYFFVCIIFTQNILAQTNNEVYLFSYFKNNGKDGLHLAYSSDGLKWTALKNDASFITPILSKDSLMRDPCIIKGPDNLFHMVWTVSWNAKGIGYASSKDLIHWSNQLYVPVMEKEDSALNSWAPEIFYDAGQKDYMIYWATTIPNRFKKGASTGDGKYNHRIYYVTTKDFTHFSKTKILYNHDFNVIDATIQKVDNKYVMFLKDETRNPPQKNIRMATSNQLRKNYSKASAPITGNYWAEGPTAIKINNEWIVYFDKYTAHTYGAVSSTDLIHWHDISDKISFPKGTRHGTVFTISKQELDLLLTQ